MVSPNAASHAVRAAHYRHLCHAALSLADAPTALPRRDALCVSPAPAASSPQRTVPYLILLPARVLVTLTLSGAKISRPAAGHGIIEELLACRLLAAIPSGGYENVLEMYFFELSPHARRVGVRAGVPSVRDGAPHPEQRGICSVHSTVSATDWRMQRFTASLTSLH